MEERLQKILARAGFGSRRACEELIRQRRVAINGQIAQLGQKADPNRDAITVDGERIRLNQRHTYIALHKPAGVLSDQSDQTGRLPTARELVSLSGHLFPIGRLDLLSEGLMLFTDDGELANLLMHPRFEHFKEYRVTVRGQPSEEKLQTRNHTRLRVVLREGRKRQIRRVAEWLGHPVQQIVRVRIGPIHLGNLQPGKWRHLTKQEIEALQELKQQRKHREKEDRG
jgi:16S rRNA U516 pseudouridylate synthase RsuA-like enzyme